MAVPIVEDHVECSFTAERIARRVEELARQISDDYRHSQDLVLIGVLKGASVFMADLMRKLSVPCRSDFVMLSSYGNAMTSSGQVTLRLDVSLPIQGADVIAIDDLVDTGRTSVWLVEHLRQYNPASIRLCTLLDKPERRTFDLDVDYVGFNIPDRFVVGYGIDCAERFRELPYIGYVTDNDETDE